MIEKGQKINDRYEIIKSIGEGGMANVYLAYDTYLDRRVAIKVLRGDLSNDEKFVRRFQREASSASNLSHPNIVEIYDLDEEDGIYYIVMEYIEGKTLKQLIKKRGALTLSEAIDIMLQVTDGISQAHESSIIHRDIKPQNIMIKEDGTIKITDFGIAMALNSTQLTQTNSVMGSVHYLPPEQANGKGSTIRSDIYSMGILFYELLTGNLPFKGENAVEIALKQMREEIPSICKINPTIPQSVENVILKATAKNPKNRYADSKEMHSDLLTVLNDERINEPKYEFAYPEHEMDENTKAMTAVKQRTNEQLNKDEEMEDAKDFLDEDKVVKRTNVIIWILASIFMLIVVALVSIFFVVPYFTKIPDVKIPDVVGLSIVEAEQKLKKVGFEVALETVKESSNKIEKGNVIRTNPVVGRTIKKGSTITLYESLGDQTYKVEDYTGANYIEIKTLLENVHGLKVDIEKKDFDTSMDYGEQDIIGQNLPAGTELGRGDSITLYIPNMVDSYPNMVDEAWTLTDIEEFCKRYNINLKKTFEETLEYPEGTIISQSREPKTPIISGATLIIKIAKVPSISEEPIEDSKDTSSEKDETSNEKDKEEKQ